MTEPIMRTYEATVTDVSREWMKPLIGARVSVRKKTVGFAGRICDNQKVFLHRPYIIHPRKGSRMNVSKWNRKLSGMYYGIVLTLDDVVDITQEVEEDFD